MRTPGKGSQRSPYQGKDGTDSSERKEITMNVLVIGATGVPSTTAEHVHAEAAL
jgi:hypothetical protein